MFGKRIVKKSREVSPGRRTESIEMTEKARIVLYTKEGCGLCHEMKAEMLSAGVEELYDLEEVDIRSDADLFDRYRYEIPVLFINGREAFRHRLTREEFRDYLISIFPGE